MRILAVDYGTKRLGIAVSDEDCTIAFPVSVETVKSDADAIHRVVAIATEKHVGKIIVGLPRNMDGSEGPMAQQVQKFVANLQSSMSVPVEVLDERLTTVVAERSLLEGDLSRAKRKKIKDKIAAQVLLQGYLYSLPAPNEP
jgi:putative holliday junction resolvase